MDTAVDLTAGIWVEEVATVGVGPVGIGVVGVGWASNLTLHLLLVSIVLLLLSFILGLVVFLFVGDALVLGCGWVGHAWVCCGWSWGWSLVLEQSLPSSSTYTFIF